MLAIYSSWTTWSQKQKCRMAEVDRHLSSPPFCSSRETVGVNCSEPWPVGFWMSPRMETLHPSWATCLTIFIVKKLFSCPLLQIVTTAFHPVTWYYLEEFDLTSFAPSLHQVFTHFGKILPEPSFLEARQSQLSQPFLSVLPYLPWGKSFWSVLDLTTLEDAWKNLF